MSPHEALVKETREWLDRARGDLGACSALSAAELPSEALFHSQHAPKRRERPFSPGTRNLRRISIDIIEVEAL